MIKGFLRSELVLSLAALFMIAAAIAIPLSSFSVHTLAQGTLTFTEFPIPTSNSGSLVITAGPDGNLWFTEQNGNNIGRITPNGTITEFPVPANNSIPAGITTGPDGNLWFTEQDGNKIGRVNLPSMTPSPSPSPSLEGNPSPSSPLITTSNNTISVQTDVLCSSPISEAAENENLKIFDTGGRINPLIVPFGQLKDQPQFTVPANDQLIACIQGADGDEVGLIAFTTSNPNMDRLESFLTFLTHVAKCTIGVFGGPVGAAALFGIAGFQLFLDISSHQYNLATSILRNVPFPQRSCIEAVLDVITPGGVTNLIACLTGNAPIDIKCRGLVTTAVQKSLPRSFIF